MSRVRRRPRPPLRPRPRPPLRPRRRPRRCVAPVAVSATLTPTAVLASSAASILLPPLRSPAVVRRRRSSGSPSSIRSLEEEIISARSGYGPPCERRTYDPSGADARSWSTPPVLVKPALCGRRSLWRQDELSCAVEFLQRVPE